MLTDVGQRYCIAPHAKAVVLTTRGPGGLRELDARRVRLSRWRRRGGRDRRVGGRKKNLACRLHNENVDLAIRSEGGSERIAVEISFMLSPKMSLERTAITLHEELAITPTWHANC
jgi:hypothetical protein